MSEDDEGRARGLKAIVHDAVDFTVDQVGHGQSFVARRARQILDVFAPGFKPFVDGVELLSSTVPLATIRAVNRLVERGTDPITDYLVTLGPWLNQERPVIAMRSDITGSEAWLADAAIGALNGAVGDYLYREKNGLDLRFFLRHGDAYLDLSRGAKFVPPSRRLAVFVHGLATTEWCWCWDAAAYHGDPAATFGSMLEKDRGFTPLYARYNSGRHVGENGRLLADALAAISLDTFDEIILIGHSMGGLVVRSACHQAVLAGMPWVSRVTRSFSLGAPHQGAPLEKFGYLLTNILQTIDHPGAKIPSEIIRRRSEGIQDLKFGVDEIPLVEHIAHYFVATTLTEDRDHPIGKLLGDVLVCVPSASGPVTHRGKFPIETECFGGILHHEIQNHPDIYQWILRAIPPR